jgi:uncharacterized membrane protein YjgN (DUF898 family)
VGRGCVEMARNSGRFTFDGGAGGYVAAWLFAAAITVVTLGFGLPIGLVVVQRWKAAHTVVGGRHLVLTGRARELAVSWAWWWPLVLVSLGLYALAVVPKLQRWVWDNTDYEPCHDAGNRVDHDALWRGSDEPASYAGRHLAPPASRLHLAFVTEAAHEPAHV